MPSILDVHVVILVAIIIIHLNFENNISYMVNEYLLIS